ncbi:hypothetical protein HYPSUDRAFT_209513 [Hypholoma sublateritium FD-334 SS-4]|uniref:Uncharacterized protein n=1 Tax=Hypholoma sublateritium (strain FD-334 SS-4) TaxID=945553 RepID=A0A0D2N2I8_HYPSF|nr:hypothetical protein HYPSUDRAFT_209513 [Hypholoma sublateritium FD-334 SS-4]
MPHPVLLLGAAASWGDRQLSYTAAHRLIQQIADWITAEGPRPAVATESSDPFAMQAAVRALRRAINAVPWANPVPAAAPSPAPMDTGNDGPSTPTLKRSAAPSGAAGRTPKPRAVPPGPARPPKAPRPESTLQSPTFSCGVPRTPWNSMESTDSPRTNFEIFGPANIIYHSPAAVWPVRGNSPLRHVRGPRGLPSFPPNHHQPLTAHCRTSRPPSSLPPPTAVVAHPQLATTDPPSTASAVVAARLVRERTTAKVSTLSESAKIIVPYIHMTKVQAQA